MAPAPRITRSGRISNAPGNKSNTPAGPATTSAGRTRSGAQAPGQQAAADGRDKAPVARKTAATGQGAASGNAAPRPAWAVPLELSLQTKVNVQVELRTAFQSAYFLTATLEEARDVASGLLQTALKPTFNANTVGAKFASSLVNDELITTNAAAVVALLRSRNNTKPALKPAQVAALFSEAAITEAVQALQFPLALPFYLLKVKGMPGSEPAGDIRLLFWTLSQWLMLHSDHFDHTLVWQSEEITLDSEDDDDDPHTATAGAAGASATHELLALRQGVFGPGTGSATAPGTGAGPASALPMGQPTSAARPLDVGAPITWHELAGLGAQASAALAQQGKRDPIFTTHYFVARENARQAVTGSAFNLLGSGLAQAPATVIDVAALCGLCKIYLHCLLPTSFSRHGGHFFLLPYREGDKSGKRANSMFASLLAFTAFEHERQPTLTHSEKQQFWEFTRLLRAQERAYTWTYAVHYAHLAMELAIEQNDPSAVMESAMGAALSPFVHDVHRRTAEALPAWTAELAEGGKVDHQDTGAAPKHEGKRQRREYADGPRREREQRVRSDGPARVDERPRRFNPALTCTFHECPGHDWDGCYVRTNVRGSDRIAKMGLFKTERAWFATLTVGVMEQELARNSHPDRVARLRPLLEAKRQQSQLPPQQHLAQQRQESN